MQWMSPKPRTVAHYLSATLALSLPPITAARASAGAESGDVCVHHYSPGSSCQANDVHVEGLTVEQVIDGCTGPGDTATVRFDVSLTTGGGPSRYDIAIFLATDGGSARDGSMCYHDYLAPPLTTSPTYTASPDPNDPFVEIINGPWWDGDSDQCGDIQQDDGTSATRAIVTLPTQSTTLTLACTDQNSDGNLDIDICTAWDNQTNHVCNGVTDAFPTTAAKCNCGGRFDLVGVPVPGATTTTTLPQGTTLPPTTTTLPPATTTTTLAAASLAEPIPARVVTIKPGRLFKMVSYGDFTLPVTDPRTDGAVLSFNGATGGQTYALPASCWSAGSDPSNGYTCSTDVCRTVKLKPTLIKAVCKPDTGTFTVPNDGDVDMHLQIGDASRYCATCGGTPGGNPDTTFLRKDCAAPATCP